MRVRSHIYLLLRLHIFSNPGFYTVLLLFFLVSEHKAFGQARMIDSSMHYVSNGSAPEWEEFQNSIPQKQLVIRFEGRENLTEQSLQLTQYEVKQRWRVLLNDEPLGMLSTDANPMNTYFAIPPKKLRTGENTVSILPVSKEADDIMVGKIMIHPDGLQDHLHQANLELKVLEKKSGDPIPCKITIVNNQGILQSVSATSKDSIAVRPGNIYTSHGNVSIGLPAGKYTIFATRGFEYSVDSISLIVKAGEILEKTLILKQEVLTPGWISSDTHIHTYTYSGHGDATTAERALSIAGEGIELPIMTDHNVKVDISPVMKQVGVTSYYTPVIGMEYTTNLGHFNIFPVTKTTEVPATKVSDWNSMADLAVTFKNAPFILNHARDIHIGFRPFDISRHIAVAGMSKDGWKLPANAMELVNSGSLQTDIFRLYRDWFGMLNRGFFLTPVGSSDSHDVSRYLVGQSRTYIRVNDNDVSKIDVDKAVRSFREGRVAVSLGLFTDIKVNHTYGAGELVPSTKQVTVSVQVFGPGWTTASKVALYANGKKIREAKITGGKTAGLKWKGTWVLPKFSNDVFLVAVAEGPYQYLPYWPLVKPFQPLSPKWTPSVIGSTGAVWIDSDGDGVKSSAYSYAEKAWSKAKGSLEKFIQLLTPYDEAVAVQGAAIKQQHGLKLEDAGIKSLLEKAKPAIRTGFKNFIHEWKMSSTDIQTPVR